MIRYLPLLLVLTAASSEPARKETLTLFIGGARAGLLASIDTPTSDGGWKLVRTARMEIRRGPGQTLKLNSDTSAELGKDLSPRKFSYVREDATGKFINEGTATCTKDGCTMHVKTTAGGVSSEKDLKLAPGVTLATAAEVRARQSLKDGTEWKGDVLVEELGSVMPASFSVAKSGKDWVIKSNVAGVDSIDTVDVRGRTLKSEVPALNAIALPEGQSPTTVVETLDVLAQSTWRGPAKPPKVSTVRFVLKTAQGDVGAVAEDRHQRIVSREKGKVVVEVKASADGLPETLTDAQKTAALQSTPYEQLSDPRVVKAAKEAKGDARTTREIIQNVTHFVNGYVKEKSLGRAYAPATTTLDTREGDCTEHSVLASALLRANGVPTRLADGVIWFNRNLGYHEWVEAYVDGEGWVPVDPTFDEPLAGPNRVKFITGTSDPSDLMTMGLSAAQAFRGLTVEVEKFE